MTICATCGTDAAWLRARLTTAETERDYQQAQADEWRDRAFAAKDVLKTANDNCERLDGERAAAEARVEALSEALRPFAEIADEVGDEVDHFVLVARYGSGHAPNTLLKLADLRAARAALACPPQQRGE